MTASVGGFVPKPHTPFQWFGQDTGVELQRKVDLLRTRRCAGPGNVNLKWHDPAATVAEGILSRGDRRIGRVVERVWRAGGTFQEWGEHFDLRRWTDALEAEGLSLDWYVHRHRERAEVLPWAHLTAGLHEDFLWDDWQSALAAGGIADCRWTPCYDCGVCTGYGIEHIVASPVAPAGGSQGTGQDLTQRRRPARRPAGGAPMKLRLRYSKLGKVRFTSHRDTARVWERAMRRAGVPVATSAGFTPRPGSASAWPCRPAPSRWPSTSTSRSSHDVDVGRRRRRCCPRRSTRCCRWASPRWRWRGATRAPARCRRRSRR